MQAFIDTRRAPALGDVRALGRGDTVWLTPGSTKRIDWARYAEAIAIAITRGAEVRQVTAP